MLIENDKKKSDSKSDSEELNNYFSQIVDSSELYVDGNDDIDNMIAKFKSHPGIKKIKTHFKSPGTISFVPISKDEIVTIINDLLNEKAASGVIPLHNLKKSSFTFDELTECVNFTSKSGKLPDSLKKGEH